MDTNQKKLEIAKILAGLAEYYGREITKAQMPMYVEDLLDLDLGELMAAILSYRRNPGNKFFPLPAQLRAMTNQGASLEDEAALIASRIAGAISRIGPYRSADAREAIGEVGWSVVSHSGGWEATCNIQTMEELPILKAQWRREALALLNYKRRADGVAALQLGGATGVQGKLTSISELLKKIPNNPN